MYLHKTAVAVSKKNATEADAYPNIFSGQRTKLTCMCLIFWSYASCMYHCGCVHTHLVFFCSNPHSFSFYRESCKATF